MAATLKNTVNPREPRQAVRTINEYLFQTLKFRGNTQTYYDPDNSLLHRVLDRRVGIPISLSVLYILVSRRLNLPVVGVGMPGHFIVKLQTQPVFIDCFNQGALLTQKDCEKLLQPYGVEFDRRHLDPCFSDQILARMLRNLIAIFENRREFTNREKFYRLFTMLENRAEPPVFASVAHVITGHRQPRCFISPQHPTWTSQPHHGLDSPHSDRRRGLDLEPSRL